MATRRSSLFHFFVLAMVAAASLGGPTAAEAVDACKARVDKKTGVITMSASNLTGIFGWRDSASADLQPFPMGSCVIAGSDLISCPLADPATSVAKVPPPSCEVCIADPSGECCTRLRGCTPGMRDCTTVEAETNLAAGSNGSVVASCPAGYKATGGGGVHAIFLSKKALTDSRLDADGNGWLCGGSNDTGLSSLLSCEANCCRMP